MPSERVHKPQPKEKRTVEVPYELRSALQEISDLIQRAEWDEDIHQDFDDALQVERLVGGRVRPGSYEFTYHVPEDKRAYWSLELCDSEIHEIADGIRREITLFCCTSPAWGCKFSGATESCVLCDYFEDPEGGTWAIVEALPRLRAFGMTEITEATAYADLVRMFGKPAQIGGGDEVEGRPTFHWAEFQTRAGNVRFKLDGDKGRVIAVTICTAANRLVDGHSSPPGSSV